jgi:hypothetical protein
MYPSRLYFLALGVIVLFITSCEKPVKPDPDTPPKLITGTVSDIEGKVYNTVKIGDQWWMAENLSVILYNDSTSIDMITDDTEWRQTQTGACCWYMNDYELYMTIPGYDGACQSQRQVLQSDV